MNTKLQALPVEERIRIVEDLWDSIAADQKSLPLTTEQKTELDRCPTPTKLMEILTTWPLMRWPTSDANYDS